MLLEHLWASLQRILAGFIAGSLLGIPIGLAMGSFRPVRKLLEPYTEFLRFIPSVAMITVAVIWFGIGEASKIFLIIYTTIFIVILNTAAGVSAIAPDKIRAAQALGATRGQIFFYVALPATVPLHPHRHAAGDGQLLHHHRGGGADRRQRGARQDAVGRPDVHAGRRHLRVAGDAWDCLGSPSTACSAGASTSFAGKYSPAT